MKHIFHFPVVDRRAILSSLAALPTLFVALRATAAVAPMQSDPLPSWNEGATKTSILDFVTRVTAQGGTPRTDALVGEEAPSEYAV